MATQSLCCDTNRHALTKRVQDDISLVAAGLDDVLKQRKRLLGGVSLRISGTTSPAGRLIFHVVGSIAEFERERISERTKEDLEAAKR